MRRLAAWMAMGLALPGLAAAAEGWEGRVEVSYTRTSGNTDTEALAASAGARLEAGGNRYAASASGLYGETEGEPTASRWAADARYERVLTGRLFGFVSAAYLKDTYAGYDARVEIGPGAGYDVVKTEAHGLAVAVGLLWNYDNFTAGPEASDTYASAKAAAEYTWRVSQAVAFGQAVDYSVSLDDTDVYFANSTTTLTVALGGNLSLGLSYAVRYQNELPAPDAERVDTTFLTSLVMDF